MLNKVMLIGNVGQAPEIRHMASGDPVANLSLATSETWRDKDTGERRERTEWHRIVCYNPQLCEVIEKHVDKGSKLYVEGVLRTRKWEERETGKDRYVTEVTLERIGAVLRLLGDPRGREASRDDDGYAGRRPTDRAASSNGHAGGQRAGNGRTQIPPARDLDDDIPF
jgi:single-strand DNA-binding protein